MSYPEGFSSWAEYAKTLPAIKPVRSYAGTQPRHGLQTRSTSMPTLRFATMSKGPSSQQSATHPAAIGHGGKVYAQHLQLQPDQKAQLETIYEQSGVLSMDFSADDPSAQALAQAKLTEIGLDRKARHALESRWNVQWSTTWALKKVKDQQKRILYQCACGYDSQARQKQEITKDEPSTLKPWRRRVPYPHTGCLAHVEIMERTGDGCITRIAGILDHNEGCRKALLERLPAIPLHQHVYETALNQLANGASLTSIQEHNQRMFEGKMYQGMKTWDPATANVRYLLLPTDNSTLYRKFNSQALKVDTTVLPEYNVDDWLDPSSKGYNTTLAEAVFHYSARADANERFKICIATKEMDEAAHKYAHHSQLILDGTFGICSSRLLLFIAMAVDEDRKGVPIAFFLFSAPTGNRATQAGYNTEILRELLEYWKAHLVKKYGAFDPYTCITDTDTKERGALLLVWVQILLLICRFHLRQCWTNHRKKVIKGGEDDYWKNHIRNHIRNLEVQIIATVDHAVATDLVAQSWSYLQSLASTPAAKVAVTGGLSHLAYLNKQWMSVPMWQSWSEWGRVAASALLKVSVQSVIPTTNHLESFNAILKRKYIRSWMHSGHRLRFDVLIMLLITRIMPAVFKQRESTRNHQLWLRTRFAEASGGSNLLELHEKLRTEKKELAAAARRVCWWSDEETTRRTLGNAMVPSISHHVYQWPDEDSYHAQCPSSQDSSRKYRVLLHRTGTGSCTCTDFHERGGACKHLWALRTCIEHYVNVLHIQTPFHFPLTLQAAQSLAPTSPQLDISEPVVPSVDWTTLQSFGEDAVGMGGDLDEGDLEDEEGQSNAVEVMEDRARPSFTGNTQAAINTQRQHRLEHDISQVLPSLHGINNLLSDNPGIPDSPEVEEFEQTLQQTLAKLSAMRLQSIQPSVAGSSSVIQLSSAAESSSGSRAKRKGIRPPSPERAQKRKPSYGTL